MWWACLLVALSWSADAERDSDDASQLLAEVHIGAGLVTVTNDPYLERRGPVLSVAVGRRALISASGSVAWMPNMGDADHTFLYQRLQAAGEPARLSRLMGNGLVGAQLWPLRWQREAHWVGLAVELAGGAAYTIDDKDQGYEPSVLDEQFLPTVRGSVIAEYREDRWGLRLQAGQGYYVERHTIERIADHRETRVPLTVSVELLVTASRWPRSQPGQ